MLNLENIYDSNSQLTEFRELKVIDTWKSTNYYFR